MRLLQTVIILFLIVHQPSFTAVHAGSDKYKPGDLVFQETIYDHSQILKKVSSCRYNHVGILYWYDESWFVFEAAYSSVRLVPLKSWISRGVDKHFVVKRHIHLQKFLNEEYRDVIEEQAKYFLGRPYDTIFSWDDERLHAAELVWKLFRRAFNSSLCTTYPVYYLEDYQELLKKVRWELSPRDTIVLPGDIYHSKLLKTVGKYN